MRARNIKKQFDLISNISQRYPRELLDSTVSYNNARKRLPLELLHLIFENTNRPVDITEESWHGYRTYITDGTYLQLQDTQKIRNQYPPMENNGMFPQGFKNIRSVGFLLFGKFVLFLLYKLNIVMSQLIKCLFVFIVFSLSATGQPVSMNEAVAIAMANHPVARNIALAEKQDEMLRQQAVELAPMQLRYGASNRLWSITQNFGSIPEHFRRAQHNRTVTLTHQAERTLALDELAWQVKTAYMNVVYYHNRLQIMRKHNHYFEALINIAEIYLAADSITELTRVSAGARYAAFQSRMFIAEEELKRAEMRLRQLMYIPDGKIELSKTELELYQIHPDKAASERFEPLKHSALDAARLTEAQSAVNLEKSKLFPAVHVGYIHQNIDGMNNFQGWMVGLSVPIWLQPQRARIKQAEIGAAIKANETEYRQFSNAQHVEMLKSLLNEYFIQINFSREILLLEARLALEELEMDFSAGRIANYTDAFTKVTNAVAAKLNHLEYINLYNQAALELEYFTQ